MYELNHCYKSTKLVQLNKKWILFSR